MRERAKKNECKASGRVGKSEGKGEGKGEG